MKTLLTTAIAAGLMTAGATMAQESTEETDRRYLDERVATDQPRSPAYGEDDTSELMPEPCPDYFDRDWAKTNDLDEPCLDPETEETVTLRVYRLQLEEQASGTRAAQPRALPGEARDQSRSEQERYGQSETVQERDGPSDTNGDRYGQGEIGEARFGQFDTERERYGQSDAGRDGDRRWGGADRSDLAQGGSSASGNDRKACEPTRLTAQRIDEASYEQRLREARSEADASLDARFDPQGSGTAKSVAQLRDTRLEREHLEATVAALDDDRSGAIDKIEALDVRGLADVFGEVDLNDDGVLVAEEMLLSFGFDLDAGYCIEGQLVSTADELEQF